MASSVYNLLCPVDVTERDVRSALASMSQDDELVVTQHNGFIVVRCNNSVTQQNLENCLQHLNVVVLPHVGERSTVTVNADWVKLVNQYKVKLHTLVMPGVTVRQSSSEVTLEGRKVDIDDTLDKIRREIAQRYQLTNGHKQADKQADKQTDRQTVDTGTNGHSVADSDRQTGVTNGNVSPDSPLNHVNHRVTAATTTTTTTSGLYSSRLSPTDVDANDSQRDAAARSTSHDIDDPRHQGPSALSAVDVLLSPLDTDRGRPSQRTVDPTRNSADAVKPVDRLVEFNTDEHIWRFIVFRFPDHFQLWNNKLLPTTDNSQHVVVLRGTKQDKTDFTDFYRKYELQKVVVSRQRAAHINQLIEVLMPHSGDLQKNVLVEFSETGEVEFIGKPVDVDKLIDWLRVEIKRFNEQKVDLPQDAKDASASVNVSDASSNYSSAIVNGVRAGGSGGVGAGGGTGASGRAGADGSGGVGGGVSVPVLNASAGVKAMGNVHTSSPAAAAAAVSPGFTVSVTSADRLLITTPLSRLNVEVCRGDLTRQRTEVIVNPANSHLVHAGGAAKAIADAAGYELVKECDKYIKAHKSLSVADVMHTTAGRLPRPINYVIHAYGPDIKRCPDLKQCSQLLQETFYNCLVYANDKLFVKSIALPAISSGTFGVPFDIVSDAAFSALMEFDKYLSVTSVKKRHITDIKFVNITADVTTTLINTFTSHIAYMSSQNQRATSAAGDTVSTVTAAAAAARVKSPVLSAGHRTPNDSDADDMSVKQHAPRSIPKVGTEDYNKCCVCGKKVEFHRLHIRGNCTHKCCSKCTKEPCTKCLSAAPAPRTKRYDEDHRVDAPTKVTNSKPASSVAAAVDDVPKVPFRRHRAGSVKAKSKTLLSDIVIKDDGKPGEKQDSDSGDDTTGASRLKRSSSLTTHNRKKLGADAAAETCAICMDEMTNAKTLSCGHKFCKDCVDRAMTLAAKCPLCGQIFGQLKGDQPTGGTMRTRTSRDDLVGFRGCGSIIISYDIPSGFQQSNHPHPGRLFKGTRRTAYLPNNSEGQEICSMLRQAFDAGLVFTVGRSVTTGEEDVVVWNDIHHKTSKSGTYGYPDYTYLTRVKSELAAKGILPPGSRDSAAGGATGAAGGRVCGTSDVSAKPTSTVTSLSSPLITPSSRSHTTTTTTTSGSSISRLTSTTTSFTPATTTSSYTGSSSFVAGGRLNPATVDVPRGVTADYSYTRRQDEDFDAYLKRLTDTSSHAASSTRVTDPHSHLTSSATLTSTLTSDPVGRHGTLTSDPVGRHGATVQPSVDLHTSSVGRSTSARHTTHDDYYSTRGGGSSLDSGPQSLPFSSYSSPHTRPQSSPGHQSTYQSTYQSSYQSSLPVDRTSSRPHSSSGYHSADHPSYPSAGDSTSHNNYPSAGTHSSDISARAISSATGHRVYRDTKSSAAAASSYAPRDLPPSRYDSSLRDFTSHSSSGVGSGQLQRSASARSSRSRDRTPTTSAWK